MDTFIPLKVNFLTSWLIHNTGMFYSCNPSVVLKTCLTWCLMNFAVTRDGVMECFDNWCFDNWCIITFNVLELLDLVILMFYKFSIIIAKNFEKMFEKIYPYQFYFKGFYAKKDFNKLLITNCDRSFPKNEDLRILIFYKFSIIIAKNFDKMFEKVYLDQIYSKEIYSETKFNEIINTNCYGSFAENGYKNLNNFDKKIGKSSSKNPYNTFNKNFDILLIKLSMNMIAVNFFKAKFHVSFSNYIVFLQNILSLHNIFFYHGS